MSDRKQELRAERDGISNAAMEIECLLDEHVKQAHGGNDEDTQDCARCQELEAREEALIDEWDKAHP